MMQQYEQPDFETLSVYLPMDRRVALLRGVPLPTLAEGAALFADISGFTTLTEALVRELGPQRGAEELSHHLNLVYDALIKALHIYRGCAVSFSGDAVTCWFSETENVERKAQNDPESLTTTGDVQVHEPENRSSFYALRSTFGAAHRAVACALAMQEAIATVRPVPLPDRQQVTFALKTAVAAGLVRRFQVGNPQFQLIDVLAGATLDRLADAEHHARRGELLLDQVTATVLEESLQVAEWRAGADGARYAVVSALRRTVPPFPWEPITGGVDIEAALRPWLLPPVYERLRAGHGEFLAELRPAVALFLRFGGIDYDHDLAAATRLDQFVQLVQHILARYEGYLLQVTMGDKGSYLYAAFGAPIAHEDDAARAMSAALELRAIELPFISGIQIGISQGRMRTGAYGGTQRRTYGVLGDDVNLAARLMQAAAPGQVLVGQRAQRAAAAAFVWERLPDMTVKGKAHAIAVHSLIGPALRRTSYLSEPHYSLPMVGREAELAIFEERVERALSGSGQIVALTAEAGMGKSRLLAECITRVRARQMADVGGECAAYGTNISYLVWQSIWRELFGLDSAAELGVQVRTLEAALAQIDPELLPRLPLLGAVLNLPIPDNDLTRSFDAKLRKSSLESLLVDCLRGLARERPLLLVLEDCHWLDALSHDLLEVIGRAIVNLPVLLLLAYRPPELQRLQATRVTQLPHTIELQLPDFTAHEVTHLIALKLEQLFGSDRRGAPGGSPTGFVEQIVTRCQGNPFYIEELLNYIRDRGITPHDARALEQIDLPSSLHSLILSRIDQLSESQKGTLKVASVIGRLFKAAVLWGAYPQLGVPQRVLEDLDTLSRLELTLPEADAELTYIFKHIITQEVAYESLPYATRARLHEQIARYLEQMAGAGPESVLDLLAYHYGRSVNDLKKREYWLKAGEAAQANYANAAAIEYYRQALSLLTVPQQVPIMLRLGQVYELVGAWSEASELYRDGLEMAEGLGGRDLEARCELATGELLRKQSHYAAAAAWFDRARLGFEAAGDAAGVGQVLHLSGTLAAQQGDYPLAQERYERSLSIRRALDDQPSIANLLTNLGILARFQGDYALAASFHEQSLAIQRQLDNRRAIAICLNNLGNVALDQGDYAGARARIEEAVAIQREIGDRWMIANALNNLGNVIRAQGDYPAARAFYEESLIVSRDLGDKWALAYLLEDLAALAAAEGQGARALRLHGAASIVRDEIGAPLSSAEQAKLERMLDLARQGMNDLDQAIAFAEGLFLPLPRAIEYALRDIFEATMAL
jgi:class 3 adenylate cyclase/tetratricopeptide (TPR) repeat protein